LSCDNSTKKKSNIKTIEQSLKTKENAISKQVIHETKSQDDPISTKPKNTIGFIKIFDIKIDYNDSLVVRNTIEYHLNNGIIYIKEFYPNKNLKSESYWVNNITPIYQIKQYNQDGKLRKVINKSVGKYDLHYVLKKIKSFKELKGKNFKILLSNEADELKDITWIINYNHEERRLGASGDDILINSKTGGIERQSYSISDSPTNLDRPTTDQLPTFPGGIKTFENYVANSIEVPDDYLINAEVNIRCSVDTYGNVANFHVMGGTKYLNDKVLRIAKTMPKWQPAKDHNTNGASNVEGADFGKYMFMFSVYFRRFE
jgi:hypothetical protein